MTDDPFSEPGDADRTLIRPVPGGRRGAPPARPAPPNDAPPSQPRSTLASPAEPDDVDRTVIRPMPGGRRTAPPAPPPPARAAVPSPPRPPVSPPPVEAGAETGTMAGTSGGTPPGTPLAAAAAPLLQLLARLRNTAHQPDPGSLYQRASLALRGFEQRALDSGVPPDHVYAAHYALCASADDAVLNTPWGAASGWAKRPLAVAFHQDTSDGSRFFEQLARLQRTPAESLPVIEIMYLCLSLGFMGRRYRQSPRGPGEIDQMRAVTGALIVKERAPVAELSPRWKGMVAPYTRARGGLPVWVVYAAALAVCGGLFIWVSTGLNAASDDQYARMLAAPPGHMPAITRAALVQPPPPPPAPPEPTALDRLGAALKPDIDSGVVSILGTPATPVVRVSTRTGFAATGAVPQAPLTAVLQRIGTALETEPGPVRVIAYTDNQPIRTVQFPSNFQLSAARAQAARAAIARTIGDAKRLSAEGRADADPIASNATAEGREQNRRIEIVLHRQE
jgi:type VI secretion system protein ImpK